MGQVPLEKLSQQLSGSRSKRTFGTVFPHGNPESHAASCTPDSGAQVCRPMTATFTRGGNRSNPEDTASPPPPGWGRGERPGSGTAAIHTPATRAQQHPTPKEPGLGSQKGRGGGRLVTATPVTPALCWADSPAPAGPSPHPVSLSHHRLHLPLLQTQNGRSVL